MKDDAISRQAALDINENHHGQMPNHINHQIWQEIKDLPSVQPKTEQMDRLYSYLNDMRFGIVPDETTQQDERSERFAQVDIIDSIMEWIDKLPSVSTEKTGRWITDRCDMYICSKCNNTYTDLSGERYGMNFCPNCGAKMEVEK